MVDRLIRHYNPWLPNPVSGPPCTNKRIYPLPTARYLSALSRDLADRNHFGHEQWLGQAHRLTSAPEVTQPSARHSASVSPQGVTWSQPPTKESSPCDPPAAATLQPTGLHHVGLPTQRTRCRTEAQSGEEQEHMDRDQEGTQGLGADFEVKEQDRWLPIANGWCSPVPLICFSRSLRTMRWTLLSRCHQTCGWDAGCADLFDPCVTSHASSRVSGTLPLPSVRIRMCDAASCSLARIFSFVVASLLLQPWFGSRHLSTLTGAAIWTTQDARLISASTTLRSHHAFYQPRS